MGLLSLQNQLSQLCTMNLYFMSVWPIGSESLENPNTDSNTRLTSLTPGPQAVSRSWVCSFLPPPPRQVLQNTS